MSDLDKTYEVDIRFGLETDTGDIEGKIISEGTNNFNKKDLKETLKGFEGKQEQTPPMYSALKIKGKPLYWWARKGVFLFREKRHINIHKIEVIEFKNNLAKLTVSCSKGTYIRSLAELVGRALHTKATVVSLRRLSVGDINSEDMVLMPKEESNDISNSILPSDFLLKHLSKTILNEEDVKKVRNGQSIYYNAQLEKEGLVRIYTNKSLFMGIGELHSSNKLSPRRLIAIN